MYPLGLGSTTLHFDWLWVYVRISTCCKENLYLLQREIFFMSGGNYT